MDGNLNSNENTEIEKALKEFELKNVEQTQQVPVLDLKNTETSKMIQWVMKLSGGAIKEEKQAEYVLLGLVVVMIVASLYLFFGRGNSNDKNLQQQMLYPPGSSVLR